MHHHRSIAQMLLHWSRVSPEAKALAVEGMTTHTFAEWDQHARRVAAGFVASAPSDPIGRRFGFVGRSAVLWGEVLAAASMVRAAGVPFNWRLSRAEMEQVLTDAEPDAVVVEAEFLPLLGHEIPDDGRARLWTPNGDLCDLAEWKARQSPLESVPEPEPDDIALIVYTSGTSGRPKGVELANAAIAANLASPAPWDIRAGETVMVPAPNFHVSGSGWIFYCLGLGAASHHVLEIRPDLVLALLGSGEVEHALTVPAVVQMLVQHPDARRSTYPRLRTLIYGGSPMSPTIAEAASEIFGCDLVQSYGMTETCGPITFLGPEEHRRGGHLLASAGRPVPGVEVEVVDPVTQEPCPVGQTGEVWTRSSLVLSGYRNQPEELAAVLTPEGWFRTGDAGYFDEEGYLYLCDRIKDMIVSGGENVYPVEVENVLMSYPGVRDVAVIGVPHERWGETVKAVVVLDSPDVDPEELVAHCRQRLAHYKCPTSIDVASELPRNPSGKILKRDLRQPYWTGVGRGIA